MAIYIKRRLIETTAVLFLVLVVAQAVAEIQESPKYCAVVSIDACPNMIRTASMSPVFLKM